MQQSEVIQAKRLCTARAQKIIESLLNKNIDSCEFLENIKNINQCHYDDVVEERFIISLCGYPLCNNQLAKINEKKYEISTKSNKVFDITDRKKYCSSDCFKASNYIKSQLPTSPLWLRKFEEIPKYELYNNTSEQK